jgi:hypothetical protein
VTIPIRANPPIAESRTMTSEHAREMLEGAAKAFISQVFLHCPENEASGRAVQSMYAAWEFALESINMLPLRAPRT